MPSSVASWSDNQVPLEAHCSESQVPGLQDPRATLVGGSLTVIKWISNKLSVCHCQAFHVESQFLKFPECLFLLAV